MTDKKMARSKDLTGARFGHLTVLEKTDKTQDRYCVWRCKCDCGNEAEVTEGSLVQGKSLSCGCLKRENQKEIAGKLQRVDGTCIEILEKRKYRRDNTSGFRGGIQEKNGTYRVGIGFKGKRYNLGTYKTFAEAGFVIRTV